MKKVLLITLFTLTTSLVFSQEKVDRFVYELTFEFSENASFSEAEKQFFIFYNGFKNSEFSTRVVAHQHHTGDRMNYKILAYTDSWDNIDDMVEQAQNYFAEKDPTMFTEPWKIVHTADAVYAVRSSLEEGYITK